MKRLLFILLAFYGCLSLTWAQDVEVKGEVKNTSVSVGKPFALDLSMKVPYGYFVEWNDFVTDTLSGQIDIIKRSPVERSADADSNLIVHQQLTLMTFDTGVVRLPAVGLTYAKSFDDDMRLKAFTEPIDLYVTTIAVDTTQAYRPIVEPIAAPLKMKDVFPWLLAILVLVLLAIGIRYFLKRRRIHVDADGNIIYGPVIPPYDKAVNDLEALKQKKLWQAGKVKEYFSSLTDIAREYIEGQFGVNAVEMTTDDILEEVKDLEFDEASYEKLKGTMQLADLVKFAKYTTTNLENDMAMRDMTDFVNESYARYQDMKAKEAAETARPEQEKEAEHV